MDFLPDKEFHKVFDRISRKINLKGAGTPSEINERLKHRIIEIRDEYGHSPLGRLQAEGKVASLRGLIFSGFGRRAIDEAIANPTGEVALTLKHGRAYAKHAIENRKRKRIF